MDEIVTVGIKEREVSLPVQIQDFIAPLDTGYVGNGFGGSYHRGDKIAAVGSTGRSTGYHLQYEIRVEGKAVNPSEHL